MSGSNGTAKRVLHAGDWVEVRSREEILQSLDAEGRYEGLPFQPEMLAWCGKRVRIDKVAHKTCDTIHKTGNRSMANAVHLEDARCDGSAHGGCEANCLLFWKDVWLKQPGDATAAAPQGSGCQEQDLHRHVTAQPPTDAAEPTWVCQITRLYDATTPLSPTDVRQYVADVTSGNVSIWKLTCMLSYAGFTRLLHLGIGYRALLWLYDRFQSLTGGKPYPLASGLLPKGQRTPTAALDLQPGDVVRVRSADEIRATLGPDSKNRGLLFDPEMVKFCGDRRRVKRRVHRLIEEPTGKMIEMKNPCIVLEGAQCRGECTPLRYGCPRAIDSYWREIWLERVTETPADRQSD